MMIHILRKPELLSGMVWRLCRRKRFENFAAFLASALIAYLSVAMSALGAGPAQAADKTKHEEGWHIEQKSSMVNDLVLDVTPSYLRLFNKRAGTITIARAPDWLLTTYNPTRKIYYAIQPAKFSGKFAMFSGSLSRSNIQAIPLKIDRPYGYKIGEQTVTTTAYNVNPSDLARDKQNEEQVWDPHVFVFEDKLINKTAANLMCHLYILPAFGHMPIGCYAQVLSASNSSSHKTKTMLKTTVLQKQQIQLTACPDLSTFKQSADENEFSNANNGNLELKDFTDYMGH
jgi:hypothetical protein